MRLPNPYRPENQVVSSHLGGLDRALDWAAAAKAATPWVQAVRKNPPPFWAMESLLKEYPISSAEGLALMRLAEALLRVPDAETAIALTADQLGHHAGLLGIFVTRVQRAEFDGYTVILLASPRSICASSYGLNSNFVAGKVGERIGIGAGTLAQHVVAVAQVLDLALGGLGLVHALGNGLPQDKLTT